jgi:hypothetical protein
MWHIIDKYGLKLVRLHNLEEVIMRKLVLILIAFIAVVTFIRAFDNPGTENLRNIPSQLIELRSNKQR